MIRRDREPLDEDASGFPLTMVSVRPRTAESSVSAAAAIVLAVLALAIVKPWGTGSPEPTGPPALTTPSPIVVTPVPTEDRTDEGLALPICLGTGAWRVVSLETWRTQDVRVWRAIMPIETATGPLDPEIPSVPIVAIHLSALGWCAPAFGPDMPVGPAEVSAWSVVGGVATELVLQQVNPTDGATPIAALYRPLTPCPELTNCASAPAQPAPRPWSTGRIVFRYLDTGAGRVAWFAAEVAIVALATSPAP